MKKIIPHITVCSFLLLIFTVSFSQVAVRASINRDKILIGEPITLKLEAKVPMELEAKWFPLDSMSHFEFIDKGKIDTTVIGDTKNFTQTVIITSFDSGRWSVPSLPLEIGNKDYLTDSLPVSVAYSNFNSDQDYHDIKDILTVNNTAFNYINIILIALTIVSIAAIIYFLTRKAKAVVPPPVKKIVSTLSPLQEALASLNELQQQGFSQNDEVKVFYTELNDILRWYIYRKTGQNTMEKTNGELMLQLKQFRFGNDEFIQLAQTLRMSDAVKFAKYRPGIAEDETSFSTMKRSIEQLDKIISS